jgi:hypothetical protein
MKLHAPEQYLAAARALAWYEYPPNLSLLTVFELGTFRDRVRQRDQIWVISGSDARPFFIGQNACHIIQRSHYNHVPYPFDLFDPTFIEGIDAISV